ncbi:MAG: hypothetical protein V4637_03535 [Pseudomonadota bacterium]
MRRAHASSWLRSVWAVLALVGCAHGVAGERATIRTASVENEFPQRKFGEIIGLQVKFWQGQPERDLITLKELGVRWVRDEVSWSEVEPTPGQHRLPSAALDRMRYYRENGIGVVFLLAYDNKRAYPPTAADPHNSVNPQAFGRYAVAVARMLKATGVQFVLEIWNEPHNTLRPLVGGSWNGKPPAPWVDHYVRMVHEAVRQVKAFDPTIKLLSDDDMWIVHYWFLEAGLPRELDGFAFHPYGSWMPERTGVNRDTDWVMPFSVVDADSSFRSAVRLLRERGRAKLGKTPEMWITEWGWAIGEKVQEGAVTEEILAGFIPRAFITAAAAGVHVMCWFSAQDVVDGPMGLTANDGRRRKSYYAFKTMSEELKDYALVRQVAGAKNLTSGVQAFLFRGERNYKIVVWSLDGATHKLPLQGAFREAMASDTLGQPLPRARIDSSVPTLTFGSAPIYVTGVLPEPTIEADLARLK